MSDKPISEAFVKTCDLLLARGFKNLSSHDGCIEHQIDDKWHIAFNPHKDIDYDSRGHEIQPISMIVTHQDMPVGLIGPFGGALMSGAESDYIELLDKHLLDPSICQSGGC